MLPKLAGLPPIPNRVFWSTRTPPPHIRQPGKSQEDRGSTETQLGSLWYDSLYFRALLAHGVAEDERTA